MTFAPRTEPLPRDVWIARCLARMMVLDPLASKEELEVIVADVADRIRWRSAAPEVAADLLFGPIEPGTKWPSTDLGDNL